jgi:hypothetical protein
MWGKNKKNHFISTIHFFRRNRNSLDLHSVLMPSVWLDYRKTQVQVVAVGFAFDLDSGLCNETPN